MTPGRLRSRWLLRAWKRRAGRRRPKWALRTQHKKEAGSERRGLFLGLFLQRSTAAAVVRGDDGKDLSAEQQRKRQRISGCTGAIS